MEDETVGDETPTSEYRIEVVDGLSEPPQVRFETQTGAKLLGSARALARALYEQRYAAGFPGDFVRVRRGGETVYTFSLLNRVEELRPEGDHGLPAGKTAHQNGEE